MSPRLSELIARVRGAGQGDLPFRRFLGNASWLLSSRLGAGPLGILQSILAARLLGVEGFGRLGIIVTFVTVANRFTSFRMNEFVVKYLSHALSRERIDRAGATAKLAMQVEAVTALISFGITVLAIRFAHGWFSPEVDIQSELLLYALVIPGGCLLESSTGTLQVLNRYRPLALYSVAIRFIMLVGVTLAWLAGAGLMQVVLAYLFANVVPAALLSLSAFRALRERLGAAWRHQPVRQLRDQLPEMARFVVNTNLSSTLSLVVKDGDLLWLGYLAPASHVGYYRLARNLLKYVLLTTNPMVKAIYPELARSLAERNPRETGRLIRRSTLVALAWIVPVVGGLALAGPWLIRTFYTPEFLPAYPAVMILALGLAISHATFWKRPAVLSLGRPDFALKMTALNAAIKVPLVLLLVPAGGYLALAAITSGLQVLSSLLYTFFVLTGLRRLTGNEPRTTGTTT